MNRIVLLVIGALSCIALVCTCNPGDDEDPGTPENFRFVCDSTTGSDNCAVPDTRLLVWTASGDDGDDGRALQYDIRWALKAMTDEIFGKAEEFKDEPEPRASGREEVVFLPRLHPGEDISFGIRALDEVARKSGIAKTGLVQLNFLESELDFYTECMDSVDNDGDGDVDGADGECASSLDGSESYGPAGAVDPGYGATVALLDNVDGRGEVDTAVGATGAVSPFTGEKTGSVSVFLAVSHGTLISSGDGYPHATPIKPAVVIYGDSADDEFGAAVSGQGDFDGDGIKDFVVGAPGGDKVYIFFGGSKGLLDLSALEKSPDMPVAERASSVADVIIKGPAGSSFGYSAALVGDVNGQSGSELVVGAPAVDAPSTINKAYIFYGGLREDNSIAGETPVTVDLGSGDMADWSLEGPAGSGFGKSVARIYDLDGLGKDEIAVGAPGIEGVFVFYGGVSSDHSLDFTATGGWLWTYNGSNYDLLLQGPVNSEFGAVLGGRGNPTGENVGSIVIGAPAEGKVYVIHGGKDGMVGFPAAIPKLYDVAAQGADWTMASTVAGFGESVSMQTDLDGNGRVDILVGAPEASDGAGDPGAVYAFYSKSDTSSTRSSTDADYIFWGGEDGARFGASVSGIFDSVRHSGLVYTEYGDFMVGAPGINGAVVKY